MTSANTPAPAAQSTPLDDIRSLRGSVRRNGNVIQTALQSHGVIGAPIAGWLDKLERIEAAHAKLAADNAALLAALEDAVFVLDTALDPANLDSDMINDSLAQARTAIEQSRGDA